MIFSDIKEILKIILSYLSVVKSNVQCPYKEKKVMGTDTYNGKGMWRWRQSLEWYV